MGLRFRKSFKIAPGVKINLGKKSTSISLGGKGVHYTLTSKGKRTTSIGIPGTGVYYTSSSKKQTKKNASKEVRNANNEKKETKTMDSKRWYQKSWAIILFLIIFFPVGLYLMWRYADWSKLTKIIITAILAFLLIFSGNSEEGDIPTAGVEENETTSQQETTTQLITEESTTQSNTEASQENTTENNTETSVENTTQGITDALPVITPDTSVSEEETTEEVTTTQPEPTTEKETTTKPVTTTEKVSDIVGDEVIERSVYVTPSGKRYHYDAECGGKNSYKITMDEVGSRTPCQKCAS